MKGALMAVACLAATGLVTMGLALDPAAAQPPAETLPVDKATVVQGVEAACTGLAQTRKDPQWGAYPVRIEFADAKAEYLTDAEVQVRTAKGKGVLDVSCGAPWVLLKLPPGDYRASVRLLAGGKPREAAFKAPKTGQVRVVITFPDA